MRGTHPTTLELTRHASLGPRGDCILAVGSSLAPREFSDETKALIRAGSTFRLELEAGGKIDVVAGTGHPGLTLDDEDEMVFRKSGFVSGRTVLVGCDKAVADLDRGLVAALRDPATRVDARLYVLEP